MRKGKEEVPRGGAYVLNRLSVLYAIQSVAGVGQRPNATQTKCDVS